MRVFMLGWEFPPHISGGLGTACYGMTKGLAEIGVDVCFVLPTAIPVSASSHVEFRSPSNLPEQGAELTEEALQHVKFRRVDAVLQAYATEEGFEAAVHRMGGRRGADALDEPIDAEEELIQQSLPSGTFVHGGGAHYGGDLMHQIQRYARLSLKVARVEKFDVIHAHDWMTFPAGMAVATTTGRPLLIHVHSTEFDRSGEHINQQVYDIERTAMHHASRVICVSHLTRKMVISRYAVPPKKVDVVYNAVDIPDTAQLELPPIRENEKIVLFLGRVTMQKGPEYFLQAAKLVVEKYPDVRFIMAGSGDMIKRCIRMAADLKIGSHVTFTGFLRGADVDRVFQMADLYVMPSVSEPFGIAPLEAMSHNVPVIISKQSGVSEVLTHALKVDFWDVSEIANKILAVLRHPPLHRTLRDHGHIELQKFSWVDSAKQLRDIYAAASADGG